MTPIVWRKKNILVRHKENKLVCNLSSIFMFNSPIPVERLKIGVEESNLFHCIFLSNE